MKKMLMVLIMLSIGLSGCTNSSENLKELPYYSYLSKSNPVVTVVVKDVGQIKLELFPDVAKNTVDNFINYVQSGAYSGSTFHRVIADFMIQGGQVTKTNCPIKGEFKTNGVTNKLLHYRGVISMARTNVANSATSQFFIMHEKSTHLDGNYAGFGGLISGFDVVDKIASVNTNSSDAPLKKIVIEKITVKLNGYKVSDAICG